MGVSVRADGIYEKNMVAAAICAARSLVVDFVYIKKQSVRTAQYGDSGSRVRRFDSAGAVEKQKERIGGD